jgi:hypothetical protein
MSDNSGEEYEFNEEGRKKVVAKYGPVMGITHDLQSLEHHYRIEDRKHVQRPFLEHSLRKYTEAINMHEVFAHQAHRAGNTAEVGTHLDEIQHALNSMHQVIAYQSGDGHARTQVFKQHLQKVTDEINNYNWEAQL